MKTIPLTKGYVALVDDKDYERVNAFKWFVDTSKMPKIMAARKVLREKESGIKVWTTLYLHRFVYGLEDPKTDLGFWDGDGLNCQMSNLRIQERVHTVQARAKIANSTSVYKGVWFDKSKNKWGSQIVLPKRKSGNGATKHLGYFVNEIAAALAYNKAAKKRFGGIFANYNAVDESMLKPITQTEIKAQNKSSAFVGVCWYPLTQRWSARITVRGKRISLGYFTDELEAAKAYNKAAKKYQGKKAKLNILD